MAGLCKVHNLAPRVLGCLAPLIDTDPDLAVQITISSSTLFYPRANIGARANHVSQQPYGEGVENPKDGAKCVSYEGETGEEITGM